MDKPQLSECSREKQVDKAILNLNKEIDLLSHIIAELTDRLTPIVNQNQKLNEPKSEIDLTSDCALATDLNNLCAQLITYNNILKETISCLEI
jgi:hypothetical protein